jgi:hypothetical protein
MSGPGTREIVSCVSCCCGLLVFGFCVGRVVLLMLFRPSTCSRLFGFVWWGCNAFVVFILLLLVCFAFWLLWGLSLPLSVLVVSFPP